MNRKEAISLFACLKAMYPNYYNNKSFSVEDAKIMVDIMVAQFGSVEYGIVRRATCECLEKYRQVPSITDIAKEVKRLINEIDAAQKRIEEYEIAINNMCKDCHPKSREEVTNKCGSVLCPKSKDGVAYHQELKKLYDTILEKVKPNSIVLIEHKEFDWGDGDEL